MTARLAPTPKPGYTIPGVGVPGAPTEQEATQAAVDYGWLIGLLIIAVIVKAAVTYLTKRIDFRLLLLLAGAVLIAYYVGKGN